MTDRTAPRPLCSHCRMAPGVYYCELAVTSAGCDHILCETCAKPGIVGLRVYCEPCLGYEKCVVP